MARRHRIAFRGAVYHVMARGIRKTYVFVDDVDRRKFLRILTAAIQRYACICYSYCMMGNHYHLVIKTPRPNISRFTQYLNGQYAKYFNWRHKYTGHVYEGRCNTPLIEDDAYLAGAIAYVARNPIEAGLVKDAAQWKWSSYRATIGQCACPKFLTLDWLQRVFPDTTIEKARRQLAQAVHVADQTYDIDAELVRGTADFQKRARKVIGATLYKSRLPRRFRAIGRPELDEIFAGVKKANRRQVVLRAHVAHGYLLSEIARYLDLHPTTISRIVNRRGNYR
jgi:putative transposase